MHFNISIVEDDRIFAEVLRHRMMMQGFAPISVYHTGQSFLDSLVKAPDLVFMDYDLGDMTALEILIELRQKHPRAEVILLSSHEKRHISADVFQLGVDKHIMKYEHRMNHEIDKSLKKFVRHFA
jgi:DNA-binding NarL/FixJ family response regulator